MGADRSDLEVQRSRDEDERDESEIRTMPYPSRSEPDFPNPDEDGFLASAVSQRVSVVTRPLPAEGVPNCSIRIGTKTATTDQSGNANVDLSDLADGEYEAAFRAPDTSRCRDGAEFPARSVEAASLEIIEWPRGCSARPDHCGEPGRYSGRHRQRTSRKTSTGLAASAPGRKSSGRSRHDCYPSHCGQPARRLEYLPV